jgi:hypothetical protein
MCVNYMCIMYMSQFYPQHVEPCAAPARRGLLTRAADIFKGLVSSAVFPHCKLRPTAEEFQPAVGRRGGTAQTMFLRLHLVLIERIV